MEMTLSLGYSRGTFLSQLNLLPTNDARVALVCFACTAHLGLGRMGFYFLLLQEPVGFVS